MAEDKSSGGFWRSKDSPRDRFRISARVIDGTHGLTYLSAVSAVRLRSKDYVMLIMEDYLPALGEIEGNVYFLTSEGEITLKDVHGFYKHQHNEFTLLVEGQSAPIKFENNTTTARDYEDEEN